MTERATGRHRATQRSSTTLSTLTGSLSVVGDYVGSVRRSGVIIAMSSGLMASMALPAQAVSTSPEAAGPATASIPMIPGTAAGEALFTAPEGGLLALPPDLATDEATIAAPAAATVDFDHSAFTVVTDAGAAGRAVDTPAVDTPAADTPAAPAVDDGQAQAPQTRRERRQAAPASDSAQQADDSNRGATKAAPASSGLGAKAVAVAFRYQGVEYRWGGTTPAGFDCSGFTRYVYGQLGVELGRTVADQRGDVRMVSRSAAKPGDLIFFGNGHTGIYLGNGRMIDAPRRGKTIQPREIYSANVQFGRVVA